VAEADGTDVTFLLMHPEVGVVTNVCVDHVDFYRDGREEIESAFATFVRQCGSLVACGDDDGARRSVAGADATVVTYGIGPANDLRVEVRSVGPDGARGVLHRNGTGAVELELPVDGAHNLLNAAAAVAASGLVGVPEEV